MVVANEDSAAAALLLGLFLQFFDLVSLDTAGKGRFRVFCGVTAMPTAAVAGGVDEGGDSLQDPVLWN